MRKLTNEALAARAQELADTMHELAEVKLAAAKVKKTWAAKIAKLDDRAQVLAEAVRLKTDPEEQLELVADGAKP